MITIRKQSMDRAAEENGSRWDADTTEQWLRDNGLDVQVVDGDWGPTYYADTDEEHDVLMEME